MGQLRIMVKHHKKEEKSRSFSPKIRLSTTSEEWANIPKRIVQSIKIDKIPHLKRIHQSISNAALLPMPPVEIVPTGWVPPGNEGMIYGRSNLIQVGDSHQVGAQIPAATLLFVNDLLLRRILVHEFTHCFWYYEQLVLNLTRGSKGVIESIGDLSIEEQFDKLESGEEEKHKVNPFEWFSDRDAKEFLEWDNSVLNLSTLLFQEHWVKDGLPIEIPDLKINFHGRFAIPEEEIIRHVIKLKGEAVKGAEQVFGLSEDEN